MKKLTSSWSACALIVGLALPAVGQQARFIPFGDLPGGNSSSGAGGVSADGQVVVGSRSQPYTAFRWTAASGNPDPGLAVPGNSFQCQAWGRDPGFPAPNNTTLSDALDVSGDL